MVKNVVVKIWSHVCQKHSGLPLMSKYQSNPECVFNDINCFKYLKFDSATSYPKISNFDVTGCKTFIFKLVVSSRHSFTTDEVISNWSIVKSFKITVSPCI